MEEGNIVRIAVCDDDKQYIENIEQYLGCIDEVDFEYDIFYGGESLLMTYREKGHIYDAVFLDMEMGKDNLNGINIANMIRSLDKQVIIVFVTSHKKYMQDCFECYPFKFLVKPIDFEKFKNLFLIVLNKTEEEKTTISFKKNREKIRLLYEEILFLHSIDHNTCIQTKSGVHDVYVSLSDLKKTLNPNIFVQTHRSYIININYISSVSKQEVKLRGYNHPIPISNNYRKDLEKKVYLLEEKERLL